MDAVETGRRVRAARAYAGLTLPELAEETEIGRSTLIEIEHGRRATKKWELYAIARSCGVPDEWFSAESPTIGGDDLAEGVERAADDFLPQPEQDDPPADEGLGEAGGH